jgi:2-iminobutanoate/2-iminopropanoate deaminase
MKSISSPNVPAAIGPYSQAIVVDGRVYTSGQIPIDPATGELVAGGIAEQAEQALKNLSALLEAAGSSTQRVIKTTVFLVDMGHFGTMNPIYERVFGSWKPARSTIAVAALPKGALIEIEAVAVVG